MDRITQIEAFLKDTPGDCFLTHALALEYAKSGNKEKARQLFEENLRRSPEYIATYYHLGQLLEKMELPELALGLYLKGIKQAERVGDQHTRKELQMVYDELAEG
jgi:tetratricopeptide (TPR) repeat protein